MNAAIVISSNCIVPSSPRLCVNLTTDSALCHGLFTENAMRLYAKIVAFFLLLGALAWAQPAAQRPIAMTHVTVIDATGAPANPDQTVVIAQDRISALGKTGQVQVPAGAQVVDATGKYLIPGLWDMHVHTRYKG